MENFEKLRKGKFGKLRMIPDNRRRQGLPFAILSANRTGTSLSARACYLSTPSSLRIYLHITSLGYAYLLSTARNLLDLRVYPFTHLRPALKGTLCHGVHNAFFPPSPQSHSFNRTPLCILAYTRTELHIRI